MHASLRSHIEKLMSQNRRETNGSTYTVPSPHLYPFEWLWDSCFHAVILSHVDITRAREEIRSATSHPLTNGLLPHIIYWEEDYRTHNWGREMRGDILTAAWQKDGTSVITQPPLIASTVWELHQKAEDRAFLEEMYPILKAHYLALVTRRDPTDEGLIGIINPDESGEDNSPRFDHALGISPFHKPEEHLEKRIALVEKLTECKFETRICMQQYFWIKDVSFNAIVLRGFEALALIAETLGDYGDRNLFDGYRRRTGEAMRARMREDERFYSLEGSGDEKIRINTWNLFMPLYAGLLTKKEVDTLVERYLMDEKQFWTPYPIPSVSYQESMFSEDDMWRGPTWIASNWFVYHGLRRYGFMKEASLLAQKSVALVSESGFREYYSPLSGVGYGTEDFTWGGLVIDME